ncbi:ribosome recycling factor [candidate division WWE3 bacterium CG10_big_fil_rev_8_21_14_0_10_32_10]|uniref:Ribosome recycling factor n=1 Tax=candidate division WWE3 bacterium CG10_big_fil_rev_8_21_14_0_10_32_10 TaxID=1975090 RepID=A0A2H0RAA6_UNCKA|nr:MAG: ribosome recycling factor [candidate division WWE3 bacterium CG10_big_fil_rev_8_21_14_0_10_32_10]
MKQQEMKNKLNQTVDHFKSELSEMRTGSANTSLIENIKVNAYEGQDFLNINELATISVSGTTLLVVDPWDKSIINKIAKAIESAGKNLNPVVEQTSIKIPVPSLTEETRKNYVKKAKEKLEEAKISVRNIRQDSIKSVEEQEENGLMGEDEMERIKKEIEDEVKSTNKMLEEMFVAKESELMKV